MELKFQAFPLFRCKMKSLPVVFLLKKECLLAIASVALHIYEGLDLQSAYIDKTDVFKTSTDNEWECMRVETRKRREIVLVYIIEVLVLYDFDWFEILDNQKISLCQRDDHLILLKFED